MATEATRGTTEGGMERIPFRQSRPGRTAIRKPNVLRISMEKKKKITNPMAKTNNTTMKKRMVNNQNNKMMNSTMKGVKETIKKMLKMNKMNVNL